MDRLAPACDGEISGQLKRLLKKKGYELVIGQKVMGVEKAQDVTLSLDDGNSIVADAVLVAVGRTPNTQGFADAGLKVSPRGFVEVDPEMRTNLPNVWAIGDITGKAMLAHVASHQGIVAVDSALGHVAAMHYDAIPACIYMEPEIAQAGLTEEDAKAQGIEYKVGRFPFSACGKALADGETSGMVKVITDKEDVLLGIHIFGPHASALIQEGVLAIQYRHTAQEILESIHAHPSLGEAVMEAVATTLERSTALPKPRVRTLAR
jgi:dihydrolipoamide dehydrogenase